MLISHRQFCWCWRITYLPITLSVFVMYWFSGLLPMISNLLFFIQFPFNDETGLRCVSTSLSHSHLPICSCASVNPWTFHMHCHHIENNISRNQFYHASLNLRRRRRRWWCSLQKMKIFSQRPLEKYISPHNLGSNMTHNFTVCSLSLTTSYHYQISQMMNLPWFSYP